MGYRINSKRGTQFRRWSSQVLKAHLIQGYSLNQTHLTSSSLHQIQQTINLLAQSLLSQKPRQDKGSDILHLIQSYTKTWDVLLRYDENRLRTPEQESFPAALFSYAEACEAVTHLKETLHTTKSPSLLFGQERGENLKGILGTLEQTFDEIPLYSSSEERAAHLLYFIIKDHPFVDGNKRIGSLLFLLYLKKAHKQLSYINDNSLIALTLLKKRSW